MTENGVDTSFANVKLDEVRDRHPVNAQHIHDCFFIL
jgi:hypothetical protein